MNILEADRINVFYGRTQRLFDVSMPGLQQGDLLGLLGANAAGKSTMMRALSGQQRYQGEIRLHGKNQHDILPRDWLAEVAFMPQTPPQETSLRPYELLWSAARSLALPLTDEQLNRHIEVLFAQLGLTDFAMAPLYSLSGGKRQLVGLALALIRQPTLLLLDEPTSALDLHWRMVVLNLVTERLQQQGGAAVAVLHDLDLAARYCTQLLLLQEGQVVAAGPVAEVLTPENIARVFKVEAAIMKSPAGHYQVDVLRPL